MPKVTPKVEVVDNPREQAADAAMVVCIRMSDRDKPDDTAIADVCADCGTGVWVSPVSPVGPPRMCHDCAIKRVKALVADGGEPVFVMKEELAKEFAKMAEKVAAEAEADRPTRRLTSFEKDMRALLFERIMNVLKDWADTSIRGGSDMTFVLSSTFANLAFLMSALHTDFTDDSTLEGFRDDIEEFYAHAAEGADERKRAFAQAVKDMSGTVH